MADVQVILREDIARLGEAGDVVSVKPGFARNFLVPQGKAQLATAANVKELEHKKRVISEKMAKELKDLRAAADRIRGTRVEIEANAGAEGKLFGSVTTLHIVELLAEKGIEIDRRKIALPEPIRSVGEHAVEIKLHRDVGVEIQVVVRGTDAPPEPEEPEEEEVVFGDPSFVDDD